MHWAGLADQPSAAHSFVTAGYGRLKVAIEVLVEIQRNCLVVAEVLKGWEGAAHLTSGATLGGAAPKSKEPRLAWLAASLRNADGDEEEPDFNGEAERAGWRLETSSTNEQGKYGNIESREKRIDTEEDSIDASVNGESNKSVSLSASFGRTRRPTIFPLHDGVGSASVSSQGSSADHSIVTGLGLDGLTIDGEVITVLASVQQTRAQYDRLDT